MGEALETNSKSSRDGRHLFAGALSGGTASVLLQPLDVIKTRMQRREVGGGFSKRNSIPFIVQRVVRHEGVAALWSGLVPTLYRTIPGVGLYFYSLNFFRKEWTKYK